MLNKNSQKSGFILAVLMSSAPAQATTPQQAITAQAGCYEVTFQYEEVEGLIEGYQLKPPKKSKAIEWIVVEEEREDFISLQHVLVSGPAMIKHWRQVWQYEATSLYHYEGKDTWVKKSYTPEQVQGKWAQLVYNVDDAPRYECIAAWNNSAEDNSWSCTTGAPLPRREKKRKDYNLLRRTNTHRLTSDGWVHEQHNTKVNQKDGKETLISKEKGYNTYVKIPDENCQKAIDWWPKRRATWKVIQTAWTDFLADQSQVTLRESRGLFPLWVKLFWLARSNVNSDKKTKKVYRKALKLMQKHQVTNRQ